MAIWVIFYMYYSLGCTYIFWPPQSGHKKFTKEMDKKILWMSVPSTFPRVFQQTYTPKPWKVRGRLQMTSLIFWDFWPLPPLVTHFTKKASGATSPVGTTPSILSGWYHLWMQAASWWPLRDFYFSCWDLLKLDTNTSPAWVYWNDLNISMKRGKIARNCTNVYVCIFSASNQQWTNFENRLNLEMNCEIKVQCCVK